MNLKNTFSAIVLALLLLSCNSEKKRKAPDNTIAETSKAQKIIESAISTHGGKLYDNAYYSFVFRKKKFTFKNNEGGFIYTAEEVKDGQKFLDSLKNGRLTRIIDGQVASLSSKDVNKYTEALNSVVYFATLPHKLKDAAVNKEYVGATQIKNEPYDLIKVSFEQEGGGVDYEDVFLYWIHANTNTMDYLAYKYNTNDGGVRFRSAYNVRTVDGIRFQDYVNYKAPIGTPLENLPKMYEAGNLEELSKIETEEITSLK